MKEGGPTLCAAQRMRPLRIPGSRGAAEDALRDGQALLTLADTLLTRDRLAAQLEKLSEKQQARAGGGAKRAADSGVLRAAEKEQLPGGEEGGARSSRR